MSDALPENPNVVIPKRIQRLEELIHTAAFVAADLREQKYLSYQIEARVKTSENRLRALSQEIEELEEQVRRKRIEAAGSFNNFRDDLTRRELELNKRQAELEVRERNVFERSKIAEDKIAQVDALLKKAEGRPLKSAEDVNIQVEKMMKKAEAEAAEKAKAEAAKVASTKKERVAS
jgi:hypothetical protein